MFRWLPHATLVIGLAACAGKRVATQLDRPATSLVSPWHDQARFVPAYLATAYSESNTLRSALDPYAVGAISSPRRREDLGGKSYGTYQFESYVYADGSRNDARAATATVVRFVDWAPGPLGDALRVAADDHGVASSEFDAVWRALAVSSNREFGLLQQGFLESTAREDVHAFFTLAQVDTPARSDPRLFDLAMGTVNQYGGLSQGIAEHVRAERQRLGRPMTADEVGRAMQTIKLQNLHLNFESSPGAWDGVRRRIEREAAMFEGASPKG